MWWGRWEIRVGGRGRAGASATATCQSCREWSAGPVTALTLWGANGGHDFFFFFFFSRAAEALWGA